MGESISETLKENLNAGFREWRALRSAREQLGRRRPSVSDNKNTVSDNVSGSAPFQTEGNLASFPAPTRPHWDLNLKFANHPIRES